MKPGFIRTLGGASSTKNNRSKHPLLIGLDLYYLANINQMLFVSLE
jgi:hypothetical protein